MTKVGDTYEGAGLQPDDCTKPQVVRIRTALVREFDDGSKIQLVFENLPGKCVTLGRQAAESLDEIFEGVDIEVWPGKDVVLYRDPSVTYGGKRIGGWRFEAATKLGMNRAQLLSQPGKEPDGEQATLTPNDDPIPF